MQTPSYLTSIVVFTSSFTSSMMLAWPAMAHENEHRHHNAHVHGVGKLNLAQEGKQLFLELTLPAHDALGFESINTPAQKEALQSALKKLESDNLWVLPSEAGCQLSEAHASTDKPGHKHDEHSDHHDDADHHEHEHDHHHDHDHDHESSHHDQDSAHLDLHATYTFQCKNPKDLKRFGTRLFEQFEHSETLKLQGLTDQGQRSAVMTRKAPEVQL